MMPRLIPEQIYFASKLKTPKINSCLVFKKNNQTFIKKVVNITPNGYQVTGLVSWATSSKTLGLVSKKQILGVILGI